MIAATPGEKAAQEIRRQHDRSPAFVLADVDVLVIAGTIERFPVPAKYYVSETHGGSADQEASTQEKPRESTINLDRASLDTHPAPGYKR